MTPQNSDGHQRAPNTVKLHDCFSHNDAHYHVDAVHAVHAANGSQFL